jgi:hypothetical protein
MYENDNDKNGRRNSLRHTSGDVTLEQETLEATFWFVMISCEGKGKVVPLLN